MNDVNPSRRVFAFGPFEVDLTTREMCKFGIRIRIPEQSFKILAVLLESPGELILRETLRSRLWSPDTYVDFDRSLTVAINRLRVALSDSADKPRYIETLPRLGYRFIADVDVISNGERARLAAPELPALTDDPPTASDTQLSVGPDLTPLPQRPVTQAFGNRFLAFSVVVLVVVAAVIVWRSFHPPVLPATRIMMVILPFENLTGDPSQDYFCEGMTEELIAQLGNLDPNHLGIIARTTSMHYKGTSRTVKDIGGELGVGYVLESSIRRVDHRIRITTQLTQVQDQRHLWARTFDRESSDILAIQRDVSRVIAEEIPTYLSVSREVHRSPTLPENSEAYVDYLKGRYFWNKRSPEGLQKSIEYFQAAIEKDPKYARAYAGLADAYLVLGGGVFPPHQGYQLGEAAAARALAIDADLAEAHSSVGYFKFIDQWDWQGADREFQRALSLDPGYAPAHHWYAIYLSAMNRMPEAIHEIEKAHELDPLSVPINANVGAIYYQASDYERSLRQLHKTVELDPNYVAAYGYMGYVYQVTGRYAEALAQYRKAQQIAGPLSYLGDVGRIYAVTGRREEARTLLRTPHGYSRAQPHLSAFTLCVIRSGLGEVDEALKLLQQAIDDREFTATELTHDLRIDNLRADSRFAKILEEFRIPGPKAEHSQLP